MFLHVIVYATMQSDINVLYLYFYKGIHILIKETHFKICIRINETSLKI